MSLSSSILDIQEDSNVGHHGSIRSVFCNSLNYCLLYNHARRNNPPWTLSLSIMDIQDDSNQRISLTSWVKPPAFFITLLLNCTWTTKTKMILPGQPCLVHPGYPGQNTCPIAILLPNVLVVPSYQMSWKFPTPGYTLVM